MNAQLLPSTTGFEDIAPDLTEQETLFLYHVEVVGLPVVRAGEISGVKSPHYVLKKPHMIAARQKFKEAIRGDVDFSREDVLHGFKQAVDQASLLGDPMAQIAGWREIAKIKGYDKQPNITFNVHGTIEEFKKQLQSMPTDRLLELAGSDVLDGDFYRIREDEHVAADTD